MQTSNETDWPDDDPTIRKLRQLGAHVECDAAGQIRHVRFVGSVYNDASIVKLSELAGVDSIDIRGAGISSAGADQLRKLLPETVIIDA